VRPFGYFAQPSPLSYNAVAPYQPDGFDQIGSGSFILSPPFHACNGGQLSGASPPSADHVQNLDSLSPSELFIVECRTRKVPWDVVTIGYNQRFAPATKYALAMKLTRLKQRHPGVRSVLPPRSKVTSSPSPKPCYLTVASWSKEKILQWLVLEHPGVFASNLSQPFDAAGYVC